jgi:hypothetical protein
MPLKRPSETSIICFFLFGLLPFVYTLSAANRAAGEYWYINDFQKITHYNPILERTCPTNFWRLPGSNYFIVNQDDKFR